MNKAIKTEARSNPAKALKRVEVFGLELTNLCNIDCTFCPSKDIRRPKGSMDFELAKRLVKEVRDTAFCELVTTNVMGDPLIYKHLFSLLEYGHSIGQKMSVITNGNMLDEKMATKLLEAQPYAISISYHSTDEDSFIFKATRMKQTYEQYKERIFNLIDLKFKMRSNTRITLTVLSTLFAQMEQFKILDNQQKILAFGEDVQELIERIKKKHNIFWPVPNYISFGNIMVLPGVSLAILDGYHHWANEIIPKNTKVIPRAGYCELPFVQFNVLWNGDTVLCCADYDGELVYDSVLNKSILEVFNSEKMHQIRTEFVNERDISDKCKKCLGQVVNLDGSPYVYQSELYTESLKQRALKSIGTLARVVYDRQLFRSIFRAAITRSRRAGFKEKFKK